ncbi:UNVERIFIED_CONTAM: hypothetical protein GTU68_014970 [Idotea baltica]|nr:hypothetical protein [Idotea baltica]
MLRAAYSSGIFPWPVEDYDGIPWFAPSQRALLFIDELRVSRSLRKLLKNNSYQMRINSSFAEVIRACSAARKTESGTWITSEIIEEYTKFHQLGFALSVECFSGTELVGGLYGVNIGGFFAGESMFHLQSNTSKLCLVYLLDKLVAQGVSWIDCQQMTPLLESFGARAVERQAFMGLLEEALSRDKLEFEAQ